MASIQGQLPHLVLHVPGIRKDASSLLTAFYSCLVITLLFVLSSEEFLHWFIAPVLLCGVIIGVDAVDWLRGRMDLMDPVGWVGLFGLHFFFVSPLLIIFWDYQIPYLPPLDNWRPWLGGMSLLNIAGLILYRMSREWIKSRPVQSPRRIRIIEPKFMNIVLYFTLGITFALQMMVFAQFGGVGGYINQYELRYAGGGFEGFGVLFAFSESFPLLLMIGMAIYTRRHEGRRTWLFILLILLIFFVIRIPFGGLRGSRSNTIFAMIWALGVVHLWIRPMPRHFLAYSAIAGILFLYVMGFYKVLGSDFGRILEDPAQLMQFEQETGRTFQGALIEDLSRANVQAYMLHNFAQSQWDDFPYARGRTYFAGYTTIIPRAIWTDKPPTKVMEGTLALSGMGSYLPGVWTSSRVYGLMGEGMLNFGVYLAPLMFITLGLLVGLVRRWLYKLHPFDIWRMWIPFLVLFCVTYIISDSDNNSTSFAFRMLVPGITLLLGSKLVFVDSAGHLQSSVGRKGENSLVKGSQ